MKLSSKVAFCNLLPFTIVLLICRIHAQETGRWTAPDVPREVYTSATDACNAEMAVLNKPQIYSVTLSSVTPMPQYSMAMCNFVFTYANGSQMSGPMGVNNLCTPELKESSECSPNRPARTITLVITGKVGVGDDRRGELGGKPFILVYTFNDMKGTFRTPPCDVSCESSIDGPRNDSPGVATLQIGNGAPYSFGASSDVSLSSSALRRVWRTATQSFGPAYQISLFVGDAENNVSIDFISTGQPLLTTESDWRSAIPNSAIANLVKNAGGFSVRNNGKFEAQGSLGAATICVSDNPSDCPGIKPLLAPSCAFFKTMLEQAQQLNTLADAIEKDDRLFANAAIEILLTGYRSPLTSVALDIRESDLPAFFKESTLAHLRATIVSTIRQKADFRETLAYTGIYHEPGRTPANPAITEDVLQYFCSLDPAQMTKSSWEALWRAGYIAYPLYTSIQFQWWLKDAAQIISEISDAIADAALLAELGFWSTIKKDISIEAAKVATYAFGRAGLKAIATKALPGTLGATRVRFRIVLGKYAKVGDPPGYVEKANELRAARFNVPWTVWDSWTETQQRAANFRFLDWAIENDMEIVLSNQVQNISDVAATDAFRRELDYLVSKGYKLSPDGYGMIR